MEYVGSQFPEQRSHCRAWTFIPTVEGQGLYHWVTREVLYMILASITIALIGLLSSFIKKKSSAFKNHFSKIIKISWDLKLQRCVPLFRGYPQASKPGVKLKENLDEKVTFAHLWQMYAVVNQRQNACPGWTARPGGQPTVLSVRNIWNLDVGLKFSFFQYCVNQPNFWEDSILPIGRFGFNEEKND